MKRNTPSLALFFLCLSASVAGWSKEMETPFVSSLRPRLWGADIGIGYGGFPLLPAATTTIWAVLGGGYETLYYFRDSAGAIKGPGSLGGRDPSYTRIEGAWRLGVEQGFSRNLRTKGNLIGTFGYYLGRYDMNRVSAEQLIADPPLSVLPDRDGLLQNAILAGFSFDDLLFDARHKTRRGAAGELSVEWAPAFFFNKFFGDSDYLRFNAKARFFFPLYDRTPESPTNLLSAYWGEFFSIDYAIALGAQVPMNIRQTFGGREQITGLGKAVRGVDEGSLDTNLKAVNNMELRLNLPAVVLADLVPGLILYWDIGYYNQVGEPSILSPLSGIVSSVGVGAFLDVLDLGTGAGYLNWRLVGENADGSVFTVSVEFGLHF